jgi:PAS domain S-box-containing protein
VNSASEVVRVLHVDDEPEVAELTAAFLERQDDRFAVETAGGAEEARERVAADGFDCIVSDYEMPGASGIDLLAAVREDHPDIPFILFTGKGSEEIASDAISAGVTDYLRKGSGADQYELLANRITNAVSQVRAERQLTEERRRFEALFENLPQAAVEIEWDDGDPITKRINPKFADVFGYDADEIVGGSLDEYLVPDWAAEEATGINRRIRSEAGQYSEEVTRPTVDGPRRFLLQTATFGDGSGAFGVYVDITERRRHEREVERQNARLRALFENFPEPTISYTYREGEPYVEDVNGAFVETFGWDEERATGEALSDLLVPSDRCAEAQRINERVKSGDLVDERIRGETADGVGDFRLRNIPVPDDEHIDGYFVYADITAYKRRERELHRERDRYRSLFENNPLVIWEEDFSEAVAYLEGVASEVADVEAYLLEHPEEIDRLMERVEIVDVNQNAVDYYDADSKAELIDRVGELFAGGATEVLAAEWAAIADGKTRFRTELTGRKLSGDRYRELFDLFVPEDAADDYSRVYVIGTDITEQKQRERELERQNERLDAFASVVSHDLKGPLSVASGRLELASEECDSDHLDAIADAHGRMSALIEELLNLARQGEPVGETEPVDLGVLPERCWGTVATADATLRVAAEAGIRADPSRLRQLFENLYRNAVEHGARDVTVTVGETDGGFYVADDGPGIPPDDREDVFEAGYSTTNEGTGFGLSIVKEVAEAHGWEVGVTEAADGGARFEFTGVEFVER